jgi:hypothetical protein
MIPKTKTIEYLIDKTKEASLNLDRVSDELDRAKARFNDAERDVNCYSHELSTASDTLRKFRMMLKEQGVEEWEIP